MENLFQSANLPIHDEPNAKVLGRSHLHPDGKAGPAEIKAILPVMLNSRKIAVSAGLVCLNSTKAQELAGLQAKHR